jgi:hypothetical protein
MSYPLFIFGAGASHDSLTELNKLGVKKEMELKKWQPPLTNEIFDRSRFEDVLNKHQEARYVDGEAARRIKTGYSLEDLLTDILKKKAPNYPEWYGYLMSFRLYLQELFREITQNYFDKRSNYCGLLSEIQDHSNNCAWIVNFNYDLLLERQVFDVYGMSDVDDYVNGSIKVIKIHGACNWFRVLGRGQTTDVDFKTGKDYLIQNAQKIFLGEADPQTQTVLPRPIIKNVTSDWEFFEPVEFWPFPDTVKYYVPDIALPLHEKRDFVCPNEHIQKLEKQLPTIDRVIIIGWKAADEFLLNTISSELKGRNVPVFVVSGKSSGGIAKRVSDKYGLRCISLGQTFTDFLKTGNCAKILSSKNLDVLIQGDDLKTNMAKIINMDTANQGG